MNMTLQLSNKFIFFMFEPYISVFMGERQQRYFKIEPFYSFLKTFFKKHF
jgi:hypothetical protein